MAYTAEQSRKLADAYGRWLDAHEGDGWDPSRSREGSDYNQYPELIDGDISELVAEQERILGESPAG